MSKMPKDNQILSHITISTIIIVTFVLVLHINFGQEPLAFEQTFKQTGIMLSNHARLDQADNVSNNEPSLTTGDQKIAVNKILSIFNGPGSANVSLMHMNLCATQDYRCCIHNPKSCIPKAVITSVIDGEGIPLPFRGITNSKQVTFAFNSFNKIGAVGFECSVDHSPFKPCSSQTTITTTGHVSVHNTTRHVFEIRMLGMDPKDSPEARFIWFNVPK
jgi:hypothetical protein